MNFLKKNNTHFKVICLLGLLLVSATTSVFAKHPKPKSSKSTKNNTSDTVQFSGLKLKGQLKKPDLSYIYQRKGLRAEQVVNIPEDFNDEIAKGAGQF